MKNFNSILYLAVLAGNDFPACFLLDDHLIAVIGGEIQADFPVNDTEVLALPFGSYTPRCRYIET